MPPLTSSPCRVIGLLIRHHGPAILACILAGFVGTDAAAQGRSRSDDERGHAYAPTADEEPAPSLPKEVLDRIGNSIVLIERLDGDGRSIGSASAFIGADGLVYTNLHCIEGAAAIKLNLGSAGMFDLPDLVAASANVDVAILKGDFPAEAVNRLSWAPTAPRTHTAVAVVVRNAEGQLTTSPGWTGELDFEHQGMLVLSTSAPAWFGCSGAPLVDMEGRVIGIINRLGDPVTGQVRTTARAAPASDAVVLAFQDPRPLREWYDANAQPESRISKSALDLAQSLLFTDTEQAIKCYQVVLGERPTDHHAAHNLAWALDRVGRKVEARGVLNSLAAACPDDPLPQLYIGHRAFSESDFAGAIEAYLASLKIRPLPVTWFWLGTAQWWKHDLEAATGSFEEVVRMEPRHTKSWESLAKLYSHLGKHDDSIRILSRWAHFAPDNPDVFVRLANAYLAAERLDEHAQVLSRLEAMNPYLANRARLPKASRSLESVEAE